MAETSNLKKTNLNQQSSSNPALNSLLKKSKLYLNTNQIILIREAYTFSNASHKGQLRKSGEPYINHPLSVASILADMKMDAVCIAAAILHDVVEDTAAGKEDIEKRFGLEISRIVDGVSKIDKNIKFLSRDEAQAENFSKMMLAMSDDLRVILVKLADRLHNMRTLDCLSKEKKLRIARETLEIYVPIALRLGMNKLRLELEEISFRTINPLRYKIIVKAVENHKGNKTKFLAGIKEKINDRLSDLSINADIYTRQKNPYSIYKKMKKKKLSFNAVFDIYGLRVVASKIDECYRIFGASHNLFKPVPGKFKDYIAIPKSNGYQALHTVLFGPNAIPIEVQIRTKEMDHFAESGIASHWQYKTGGHSSAQAYARDWLQNIIEMKQNTASSIDLLENIKVDLFPDEIYIFTPKGEIKELPYRSSVIDYAYSVHSDIGKKCTAAKINDIDVPLSTTLSSGQTVEIITTPLGKPHPSWLEFVVTVKARTNIKSYLRKMQSKQASDLGLRILDKALHDYGTSFTEIPYASIRRLLDEYNLKHIDDLFIEIGLGNIVPHLAAQNIAIKKSFVKQKYHDLVSKVLGSNKKENISIKGTEGLVLKFAKCCRPIPGDNIVGQTSSGNGFVVHRSVCNNIKKSKSKKLFIEWSDEVSGDYQTQIRVFSEKQRGVLANVAGVISRLSCNIENVKFDEVQNPYASFVFTIDVKNRKHLADLIKELKRLKNINKVMRTVG
ncbi:MAG: bifunctional GTP diphosphokinase/guanosine-3',5'-bis(diphosphate) 3'-diphosphatase [Gammaproteobacteria bacterium]|nr:bifunctional GTP diphosphokinase/guanosine-3',5'-bis(diphosphate) 3'-diphosphatase [Gammaproteobacteria bacterium]